MCLTVCLSVCEHISGTAAPIGMKFCLQIPCGHGSVLLWQHCDTLCTSGFMDDVTFGHSVVMPGAECDVYECLVLILCFVSFKQNKMHAVLLFCNLCKYELVFCFVCKLMVILKYVRYLD